MVGIIKIDVKYRCGNINCPRNLQGHYQPTEKLQCTLAYDLNSPLLKSHHQKIPKNIYSLHHSFVFIPYDLHWSMHLCFSTHSFRFFLELSLSLVHICTNCVEKVFWFFLCYTVLLNVWLRSQFSYFWIGNCSKARWLIYNRLLRLKMWHPEKYFWSYVGCLLQRDWISRSLHVPKIL